MMVYKQDDLISFYLDIVFSFFGLISLAKNAVLCGLGGVQVDNVVQIVYDIVSTSLHSL